MLFSHRFTRVITTVLLMSCNTILAEMNIIEYGEACKALIGEIPAFNCVKDGTVVPITVNGVEVNTAPETCDRPSLLPLGEGKQCTPFSRIVLVSDGDVQISALCRRKQVLDKDINQFDEVDMIVHSVKNGKTCWFQASPDKLLDTTRVPPPYEKVPPKGHIAATQFWNEPQKTAGGGCGYCHDSDPFMYSPYMGQVYHLVPADPFGLYSNDIGPFKIWQQPDSINTRGNTCTTCHRIGSQHTCNNGIFETFEPEKTAAIDDWAKQYPHSHWMPPDNYHSKQAWDIVYRQSINDLSDCCNNPSLAKCIVEPIPAAR